jgi:hypothetical protein
MQQQMSQGRCGKAQGQLFASKQAGGVVFCRAGCRERTIKSPNSVASMKMRPVNLRKKTDVSAKQAELSQQPFRSRRRDTLDQGEVKGSRDALLAEGRAVHWAVPVSHFLRQERAAC